MVIPMYDKKRGEERISFKTTCVLNLKDSKYACVVDNISTTGALIELCTKDQKGIHMGDTGTLKVLLLSPVTYLCKVIRVHSNQIGLHFVEQ